MRRLLDSLRAPIDYPGLGALTLIAWHTAFFAAIVAIPTLVLLSRPLRAQSPGDQLQYWVWGAMYLLFALAVSIPSLRGTGLRLWSVPLLAGLPFALGYLVLRYALDATLSRKVAAASLALACVGVLLPLVWRRTFFVALATVAAAAAFAFWRMPPVPRGAARERVAITALQPITITEHHGLVNVEGSPGGAITRYQDGILVITARGALFRVDFPASPGRPVVNRLDLTLPTNKDSLLADSAAVFREAGAIFDVRANDVLVDTTTSPPRVYATNKHWHHAKRCLTIRVSSADLPRPGIVGTPEQWSTVYETSPCTPMTYERGHGGFGSRLAWEGHGRLLLTVGDFGYGADDGVEGPQDPVSPYGKVLRIDVATGRSSILTRGHRNPQGLSVGDDGSIWSSEHGPQGGDEVNVLEEGANYGWPLATYGVQYGLDFWPLAKNRHDHGDFHEPAFAFTPSIGISNLIHVRADGMPAWGEDLLLASLKDQSLFRLRRRGDRVISYERIRIGYRLRDLEQLRDGRVVLWTDSGALVTIERASVRFGGAMRYAACVGCHGDQLEGTPSGPSLRGIVGRAVASDPGFSYSAALRSLGGRWTPERLTRFLENPSSVAPGTTMSFEGMDREAIYPLLEYLRNQKP